MPGSSACLSGAIALSSVALAKDQIRLADGGRGSIRRAHVEIVDVVLIDVAHRSGTVVPPRYVSEFPFSRDPVGDEATGAVATIGEQQRTELEVSLCQQSAIFQSLGLQVPVTQACVFPSPWAAQRGDPIATG